MVENFLSYIVEELSVNKTDSILLAVSGGIDSMVMLDLFIKSKHPIQVAHVNHSTRNGQSDKDARFVENYCTTRGIIFHSKTLDYLELSKGNFQQNARIARYAFFKLLMSDHQLDHLATAHHMDDRWETFVMNLNRKSGLIGLTGLKPQIGSIIRPLMRFTKEEVLAYAKEHVIKFVEDTSNKTDDYTRNKVRHHITASAKEIFPDFIKNVNQSINNLAKSQNLIESLVQFGNYQEFSLGKEVVDLEKVKANGQSIDLLYHIISTKGFTYSDTKDILSTKTTGALFYSNTHEALYDRNKLIIRKKSTKISDLVTISNDGEYHLQSGRTVHFTNTTSSEDNDTLRFSFPIEDDDIVLLRSLKPGDKYKPSHMKGKTKSLKKLLGDFKVDRFTKESILVLEINGEIKKIIGLKNKK